MKKIMAIMLFTIAAFSDEFNPTAAEAEFTQITHEINQADKELAERMCGVCQAKIAKYKDGMRDDELARKTLETYEARLVKFCSIK